MSPTYRYPRPAVTLDVALFAAQGGDLSVLLIQRGKDPFAGRWALPGGFLDMDEELEVGARRELEEETGLRVGALEEVGAFGRVGRDPRGRTVSVVYAGLCIDTQPAVEGRDDAHDARWFRCARLPRLAFDHGEVVRRARQRLVELIAIDGTVTRLLPRTVDAKLLENVHGAVLGETTSGVNLRRRLRNRGVLLAMERGRDRVRRKR